jgi:hypothetical protein
VALLALSNTGQTPTASKCTSRSSTPTTSVYWEPDRIRRLAALRGFESGGEDWTLPAPNPSQASIPPRALLIRRFLLQVLPSGFVRIRKFGFLANRVRQHKLEHCRALLVALQPASSGGAPSAAPQAEDPPWQHCPVCKLGRLLLLELLPPAGEAFQDTS